MIKRHCTFSLIVILIFLTQPASTCHYTCQTCQGDAYSECLTCPENEKFYQPFPGSIDTGACTYVPLRNINVVGIIITVLVLISCFLLRTEEPFYYLLTLQTIGLAYFVQARWLAPLDYLLNALTYFMPLSAVLRYSKDPNHSLAENSFRAADWFQTASLPANIAFAGIVSLVLIAFTIFIPLFKVVRRCLNNDRHFCFPEWLMQKIQTVVNLIYLLLIQECMLVIAFGLGFGTVSTEAIVICVFYIISLLLFTINLLFDPLPIFRNRAVQVNTIMCKAITPLFLGGRPNAHFLFFILFFLFTLIELALTHTNKNSKHLNRMFYYRILGVIFSLVLTTTFILQFQLTQEGPTNISGLVTLVLLILILFCFNLQSVLIIKHNYCDGPEDTSYTQNGKENTEAALPGHRKSAEETWDELHVNELRLENSHYSSDNNVGKKPAPEPYIVSEDKFNESQQQNSKEPFQNEPYFMTLQPIKISQRKNKLPPLEHNQEQQNPSEQVSVESDPKKKLSLSVEQSESFEANKEELQANIDFKFQQNEQMEQSGLPFHNKSAQKRKHRKK